jgi:hypothetical protein
MPEWVGFRARDRSRPGGIDQAQVTASAEQCLQEIAAIEAQIRAGHPDLEGLCLALADWSGELRLLKNEDAQRNSAAMPVTN